MVFSKIFTISDFLVQEFSSNIAIHLNLQLKNKSNFRDDFAALCSCDDAGGTIERHQIFIYNLTNLTVLHSFTGHLSGIFQVISSGDILITRDKDGVIFLWDADLAIKDDYKDTEPENAALIRKFDLPHRDKFLGVDVDLRRMAICKIGGVQVLDFWDSAES